MPIAKLFADGFARNHWVIEAQTEGITHADALTQPPYNVNCLNWVLGHIADSRDRILEILGREALLTESEGRRYRRDSDPIAADGPEVIPLSRLLEVLGEGQRQISEALDAMPEENLLERIPAGDGAETRAARLQFHLFHDSYHVGQTELLRQMSGKSDKII